MQIMFDIEAAKREAGLLPEKLPSFVYMICETETGFYDGYYMSERGARVALNEWREKNPHLHYGCFASFENGMRKFPDEVMINYNLDDPRRKESKKTDCKIISLNKRK